MSSKSTEHATPDGIPSHTLGLSLVEPTFEVLIDNGHGHFTVERVAATSEDEARKLVGHKLAGERQPASIRSVAAL